MSTPAALRVMEGHARVYRYTWRGSAVTTFLNPVLYLGALGMWLGELVDRGQGADALGGHSYLAWIAPGLLAASSMQTGFGDSAWPVMAGLKWRKTYQATLATPVGVRDLVVGHLAWVAVRIAMTAAIFAAVALVFGAMDPVGAVAVVPAGVLTGLAFAGPITAFTAWIDRDLHLASLQRFVILPMFLFAETIFPLSRLPESLHPVAYVTPLWHGVQISRGWALGDPTPLPAMVHVAVLASCAALGLLAAVPQFRRKLTP